MISDRERKVIDNYIKTLDKGGSLREAGYAASTCRNPGQVFSKPEVAKEIKRRLKIVSTKAGITAEYVLKKIQEIVEADIGTLLSYNPDTGDLKFDWESLTDEQKRSISEVQIEEYKKGRGDNAVPVVKTRVKPHSKMEALKFLAQYLGMLTEKIEIKGELNVAERIIANRKAMQGGSQEEA